MTGKCIFITGSTGVGKTKLSIDLAKKINTEIINIDAMQMNKPLDITLNKATSVETLQIKHHLLSFLDVEEGVDFDVNKFKHLSMKIISELHKQSKIPILVGGTTYYMEALIYEDFLSNSFKTVQNEKITQIIHPNQLRKIRNNNSMLNIVKPSLLRYPNSLIIWLDFEDRDQFKEILSMRIEKMVENGLVEELCSFVEKCSKILDKLHVKMDQNEKDLCDMLLDKDETNERQRRGILQCIGLKEFCDYIRLSSTQRESKEGAKVLNACKSNLLTSTFKYAVRQKRWMNNRFIRREPHGSLPIFRVNVDAVLKTMIIERNMPDFENLVEQVWNEKVFSKIQDLVEAFLSDQDIQNGIEGFRPEKLTDNSTFTNDDFDHGPPPYTCLKCDQKVFYDLHSYKSHLNSNKHKKRKNPAPSACQEMLHCTSRLAQTTCRIINVNGQYRHFSLKSKLDHYQRKLENQLHSVSPTAYKYYDISKKGIAEAKQDISTYVDIVKRTGFMSNKSDENIVKTFSNLSLAEVSVVRRAPKELLKTVSFLSVILLPGTVIILPILFLFPKYLIKYLWTDEMRKKFYQEEFERKKKLFSILSFQLTSNLDGSLFEKELLKQKISSIITNEHRINKEDVQVMIPIFDNYFRLSSLAWDHLTCLLEINSIVREKTMQRLFFLRSLLLPMLIRSLERKMLLIHLEDGKIARNPSTLHQLEEKFLDELCLVRGRYACDLKRGEKISFLLDYSQINQSIYPIHKSLQAHLPYFYSVSMFK